MKVSVAIPCYNAEKTIGETLESILAQTRPADEIVVADDCSTDSSRDVIARFPSVRLVVQQKNSGCAASRNLAIRSSSSELVAIVDADDIWYPDHLESTIGLLEQFPECGFAFSGNDRFGGIHDTQMPNFPAKQPVQVVDEILPGNQIHQLTVAFHRALYDECGGFDETMRYCEDYDMWLRFGLRTPGVFTGKVTTAYRIHAGQLNRHLPQMFDATWFARLKLLDEVRATRSKEEAESLEAKLNEIWVAGLYTAWAVRSRESLDVMLGMSDRFPKQHRAAKQWRLRRTLWPLLVQVDRVSKLMPNGVREVLRPRWGTHATPIPRI